MKIYISGQITGLNEDCFLDNFHDSKLQLFSKFGFLNMTYVNPLELKPFLGVKNWLCYMINDIRALRKCTHIAMQKNWVNSKGSVIEYFIAKFILKLEVIWL